MQVSDGQARMNDDRDQSMVPLPFSEDSVNRRLDYLRRFCDQTRKYDAYSKKTDKERINKQVSLGYVVPLNLVFFLIIGGSSVFSNKDGIAIGWVYPCVIIGFSISAMCRSLKFRWARKLFDVFGVEMVSEIESKVVERTAPAALG
jgi:hypothetical protein